MNDAFLDRVSKRVLERLREPYINLEASGRHVHLTREAVERLFGAGYQLTPAADLSQPGQYACRERVALIGPKKQIPNVVVLGPERPETQVEISLTDTLALGIEAPVHMSGNIEGSPGIKLAGPCGELVIPRGVIVALRHIHITPEDAARFGIQNKKSVNVAVDGARGVVFQNVALRISPKFSTRMHIDYDEANACGFFKGMRGRIESGR